MTEKKQRRPRDPEATREAILEAARTLLAKDGPEGISLSEVAHLAGVNRGTAYQHFESRENLIQATADWVSDRLFTSVFGSRPCDASGEVLEEVDPADLTDRMSSFAMENPELCRIWLTQLLSSSEPEKDPFWREYHRSFQRFAHTGQAQEGIDTEAFSVLMLSGSFLWPIWARSHAKSDEDRKQLARRFSRECLRLSMFGTMKSEQFPQIAERLEKDSSELGLAGAAE